MIPSASFIFWAKKTEKNLKFHSVFTWNCVTIKNKISEVYSWNLIFYIKQAIKTRVTVSHQKVKILLSFIDEIWNFQKKWKSYWVSLIKYKSFKKKWKCSLVLWFQNDAWIFMKNLIYGNFETCRKVTLICHSFTETVKLVSEIWSWIANFVTYMNIPEK